MFLKPELFVVLSSNSGQESILTIDTRMEPFALISILPGDRQVFGRGYIRTVRKLEDEYNFQEPDSLAAKA
jgi:hypothetical protein